MVKLFFEPSDFKAMFTQFSGPELHFTGASFDAFRFTPDGFRFELTLPPGFQLADPGLLLGGASLNPGNYLVTGGSELSISNLAPPQIDLGATQRIRVGAV